ncbi:MAG: hypothetical protein HYR91_00315, partial [Flavobacteriia bacterium]|nr:hypothetical protein [Flavobacteriia bacterium]
IIPSSFLGEQKFDVSDQNFTTTFYQKVGYSYGATIRIGLTKLLAFETGINYNKRNFGIKASLIDSNFYEKNNISFVNYDIPLNGLVYIQMSERFYANVSMGAMLSFGSSNIKKVYYFSGVNNFIHEGQLARRTNINVNASIGFEYRTEKKGYFYFGGSAVVPIAPLFYLFNYYRYSESVINVNKHPVKGSYMTIDLKYFFPNIKNKGTQFTKGPID